LTVNEQLPAPASWETETVWPATFNVTVRDVTELFAVAE